MPFEIRLRHSPGDFGIEVHNDIGLTPLVEIAVQLGCELNYVATEPYCREGGAQVPRIVRSFHDQPDLLRQFF